MTNYKPEDVEALVEAIREETKHFYGNASLPFQKTFAALAKFAPNPERVYVLPEWEHRTENQIIWCRNENVSHDAWIQLRYFTTTDAPALHECHDATLCCSDCLSMISD